MVFLLKIEGGVVDIFNSFNNSRSLNANNTQVRLVMYIIDIIAPIFENKNIS